MTEPEASSLSFKIAHRLLGTQDDFELVVNEEMGLHLPHDDFMMVCRWFDQKAWPCKDCEVWTPPIDLKDELCHGCR